jgi:hypothetical protein
MVSRRILRWNVLRHKFFIYFWLFLIENFVLELSFTRLFFIWKILGKLYAEVSFPIVCKEKFVQEFWFADNSSPDNSSLGYFFAGKFFARMILCRKTLRPDNSSPENFSLKNKFPGDGKFFAGAFFAQMILRQIILR